MRDQSFFIRSVRYLNGKRFLHFQLNRNKTLMTVTEIFRTTPLLYLENETANQGRDQTPDEAEA